MEETGSEDARCRHACGECYQPSSRPLPSAVRTGVLQVEQEDLECLGSIVAAWEQKFLQGAGGETDEAVATPLGSVFIDRGSVAAASSSNPPIRRRGC